jgi:hypothetical protein
VTLEILALLVPQVQLVLLVPQELTQQYLVPLALLALLALRVLQVQQVQLAQLVQLVQEL